MGFTLSANVIGVAAFLIIIGYRVEAQTVERDIFSVNDVTPISANDLSSDQRNVALEAIVDALHKSVVTTAADADIRVFQCLSLATTALNTIDPDQYQLTLRRLLPGDKSLAVSTEHQTQADTSRSTVTTKPRAIKVHKDPAIPVQPQCASRLIRAPAAWRFINTLLDGRSISLSKLPVAIVDSGARLDHPALKPHIDDRDWQQDHDMVDVDNIPNDEVFVAPSALCPDSTKKKRALIKHNYGHGTHIAGIIGAYLAGRSPRGVAGGYVDLEVFRVIDENNDTDYWEVREGICRAGQTRSPVHNYSVSTHELVAMSFVDGQPMDTRHQRWWREIIALREQLSHGDYLAVVAAGNEGRQLVPSDRDWLKKIDAGQRVDILKHFPAGFDDLPNVISVAGTRTLTHQGDCLDDRQNDWPPPISAGSNYHAVDIAAPGWEVNSTTVRTVAHEYDYGRYVGICKRAHSGSPYTIPMVGTSYAAPYVTGAAALCIKACQGSSAAGVKVALMCSADPYPSSAKRRVRSGFLNVEKLVRRCSDPAYCDYLQSLARANPTDLSTELGSNCVVPEVLR